MLARIQILTFWITLIEKFGIFQSFLPFQTGLKVAQIMTGHNLCDSEFCCGGEQLWMSLNFTKREIWTGQSKQIKKFWCRPACLFPQNTSYTVKSNKCYTKLNMFYHNATCSSKSWWCVAASVWSWGLGSWGMARQSDWWSPARPSLCVSPGTHRCGDVSHSSPPVGGSRKIRDY